MNLEPTCKGFEAFSGLGKGLGLRIEELRDTRFGFDSGP